MITNHSLTMRNVRSINACVRVLRLLLQDVTRDRAVRRGVDQGAGGVSAEGRRPVPLSGSVGGEFLARGPLPKNSRVSRRACSARAAALGGAL